MYDKPNNTLRTKSQMKNPRNKLGKLRNSYYSGTKMFTNVTSEQYKFYNCTTSVTAKKLRTSN